MPACCLYLLVALRDDPLDMYRHGDMGKNEPWGRVCGGKSSIRPRHQWIPNGQQSSSHRDENEGTSPPLPLEVSLNFIPKLYGHKPRQSLCKVHHHHPCWPAGHKNQRSPVGRSNRPSHIVMSRDRIQLISPTPPRGITSFPDLSGLKVDPVTKGGTPNDALGMHGCQN